MIKQQKLFPLADRLNQAERERFGLPAGYPLHQQRSIRAVWSGEKRPPRRGEWYLSGAPADAYRAPADLSDTFHIARLVRVRERTVVEIVTDKEEKA